MLVAMGVHPALHQWAQQCACHVMRISRDPQAVAHVLVTQLLYPLDQKRGQRRHEQMLRWGRVWADHRRTRRTTGTHEIERLGAALFGSHATAALGRRLRAAEIAQRLLGTKVSDMWPGSALAIGGPRTVREAVTMPRSELARWEIRFTLSREGRLLPTAAFPERPPVPFVDLNVMRRIWAPSIPVLHLAWSLHSHLQQQAGEGAPPLDIQKLLRYPDWAIPAAQSLVQRACVLEAAGLVAYARAGVAGHGSARNRHPKLLLFELI